MLHIVLHIKLILFFSIFYLYLVFLNVYYHYYCFLMLLFVFWGLIIFSPLFFIDIYIYIYMFFVFCVVSMFILPGSHQYSLSDLTINERIEVCTYIIILVVLFSCSTFLNKSSTIFIYLLLYFLLVVDNNLENRSVCLHYHTTISKALKLQNHVGIMIYSSSKGS